MNTRLLFECIGSIDDEYIDLYALYRKPQTSRFKIAAAAAACILATAGVTLFNMNRDKTDVRKEPPEQSSAVSDSSTSNVIISKALQEALDNAVSEDERFRIRVILGAGDLSAHKLGLETDENGTALASVREIRSLTAEGGTSLKVYLADELDSPAEKSADDSIADIPAITDKLAKAMRTAEDFETIPVAIELRDDLDLIQLEAQAVANAGLTNDELMALESEAGSSDPIRQQELKSAYDRIGKERVKLLNRYYSEKNNSFIESAGLKGYTCTDVSDLTSFIGHIELPKDVILSIAKLKDVAFIWYAGENAGRDF